MHSQKIEVWCAISRRRIVGSIFFETTEYSVLYQDIVTQCISLLEIDEEDCWLQQNNATCHTSNETMIFLREFFGERIISKGLCPPPTVLSFYHLHISSYGIILKGGFIKIDHKHWMN